jgi:hypothetical protein
VEVTVPRNRNRSGIPRVKIHWRQDPIPEEDVTSIDGIPVTKPARTLLDLAETEPVEFVERCLDEALRRRLVSLPFLEQWLADTQRRRHRGAGTLQRLVDARATVGITESPLEAKALALFRDAGLPIPMLQYDVRDGDVFIGRLDFAYPDKLVGIEVDGFRYHDTRREFDADRLRLNRLQAMGWLIVLLTSQHIEDEPAQVVRWVAGALEARRGRIPKET